MTKSNLDPVLIIGGSGFVGARAAATLRELHPDLPIAIGGRDMAKAGAVASSLGHANAVAVDLARVDLGQPDTAVQCRRPLRLRRQPQRDALRAGPSPALYLHLDRLP